MVTYLNSAVHRGDRIPIEEYHLDTPLEEYDLNFCLPVKALESNGVRLEPLVPSLHARALYAALDTPLGRDSYLHIMVAFPPTLAHFLTYLETYFRRDPSALNFVILDTSRGEPKVAGSVGLIKSSEKELRTEIGRVIVLPEFQRTHVTTHAVSLLLQYALEPAPLGLALRRVQWQAYSLNGPSQAVAIRFGFVYEATHKWEVVCPPGVVGVEYPGDERRGRHHWTGSLTWQGWREGGREKVEELMRRPIVRKQ